MGYFNYFIKCVIRNITYRLCKPKTLLFLLAFAIIISFCSSSFAATPVDPTEWNTNVLGAEQHDNIYDTLRNIQIDYQNQFITKVYALYALNPTAWKANIQYIFNDFTYSGSGQRGILVTFNSGVFYVSTYSYAEVYKDTSNSTYSFSNITFDSTSLDTATVSRRYLTSNNAFYGVSGEVTSQTEPSAFFFVLSERWIDLFIDLGIVTPDTDAEILSKLQELINKSNSSNTELKDAIEQGNDLQQEQNQIQQEQNDFLKQDTTDSDVSIDSFNSVDSNDITSSGLTGIFNTIYNSISSWSSKDIVLPVPFTNKSIRIQANYTNNMLNSVGGQTLINIVSTIYYFLVARFIIYSITGIINSIKSGSILETDTKNNITTEML